jgi:tryptophan-rich sensory protein
MKRSGRRGAARWWEVALLTVAVSILSRVLIGNPQKQNRKYYEEETKQPAWAPPGWVFAPAWTINNVFLIKALLELLRKRKDMPQQKQLLILQVLIWSVFFSFGYFYFRKQSSLMGGVLTVADAGLAIASFIIARRGDKQFANHYLPLVVWTAFASTLAVPQALWNDDRLFGVKAMIG